MASSRSGSCCHLECALAGGRCSERSMPAFAVDRAVRRYTTAERAEIRRTAHTDHMSATFLYDGDCAFCSTCARFIDRRLRPDAEVIAWQLADLGALGVTREAAEEAVQWIDGGRVAAGPDAISRLLRVSRWYWRPAGWVLAIPVVRWLAWPVYRWISR